MANCQNCGAPLGERDRSCRVCGANVAFGLHTGAQPEENGGALAGLGGENAPLANLPDVALPPVADGAENGDAGQAGAFLPTAYNNSASGPQVPPAPKAPPAPPVDAPPQTGAAAPPPPAGSCAPGQGANAAGTPAEPLPAAPQAEVGTGTGGAPPAAHPVQRPLAAIPWQNKPPAPARKRKGHKGCVITAVVAVLLVVLVPLGLFGARVHTLSNPGIAIDPTLFGPEEPARYGPEVVPQNYAGGYLEGGQYHLSCTAWEESLPMGGESSYDVQFSSSDGKILYYRGEENEAIDRALYMTDFEGPPLKLFDAADVPKLCDDGRLLFVNDPKGDLYRYRYGQEAPELVVEQTHTWVPSPSGSCLLLRRGDEWTLWKDGGETAVHIPPDAWPFVVADDGETYSYVRDNEGISENYRTLCFMDVAGTKPRAVYQYEYYENICVNRSGTEYLIQGAYDTRGLYRYANGVLAGIDKGQVRSGDVFLGRCMSSAYSSGRYEVYDVDSFSSFAYTAKQSNHSTDGLDNGLYYKTAAGPVVQLDSSAYSFAQAACAPSTGTLVYKTRKETGATRLWCTTVSENGTAKRKMIAQNPWTFSAAPDCETVFYTTYMEESGSTLYRWTAETGAVEVAQNVAEYSMGGPGGGNCFYLIKGEQDDASGEAYLYTPEEGSRFLMDDVCKFGPISARGGAFLLANPVPLDDSSHLYSSDLWLCQNGELLLLAEQTENVNL